MIRERTGYFARWAENRAVVRAIVSHLRLGGVVIIATHLRATQYDSRHVDLFRATPAWREVRHGKRWDAFNGCAVRFYSPRGINAAKVA